VPATNVGKAWTHVEAARAAGMAVSLNIVRVSELPTSLLADCAHECGRSGASILYLADSNGSMWPDEVARVVRTVRAATDIPLGFHPHDNLRLAFVNSIAALSAGASAVDGSVFGIGKGGGNLPIELAAAHMAARGRMSLRIEPLVGLAPVVAAERAALEAGGHDALVTGLLDVNLDDMAGFHNARSRHGLDALLSGEVDPRGMRNATVSV
jgi:4-hydroxy 2-oxovalerate aldolase